MKRIFIAYLGFQIAFLAASGQTPVWDWVKGIHTPEDEKATAVASDPFTGEVYVAGNWNGVLSAVFPVGATESTNFDVTFGGQDGIVVKLDPVGEVIWAFKVGGPGDDRVDDIHVDHEGNLYVTGWLGAGDASLTGTQVAGSDSVIFVPDPGLWYLAKYDPFGGLMWMVQSTNNDLVRAGDIASNKTGVFVTGQHMGAIQFGPLAPYNSLGGWDMFLAAFTPDGAFEWHAAITSDGDDSGQAIACDETAVWVAGNFRGTMITHMLPGGAFVPGPVNSAAGQADVYLAGYSVPGDRLGTLLMASSEDDNCTGLAMDDEHLYLTGTIGQEALFPGFPGNPVPYNGGLDGYVSAIGRADRLTRWVRTITGESDGDQVPAGLSLAPDGSIVVTGSYTLNLQSTDNMADNKGMEDVFVTSFSNAGDELWLKTGGGPGIDRGNDVCAATPGVIYVAGEYGDDAAFATELLPGDGLSNIFAGRLLTDCVNAVGGVLSSPDIAIQPGEAITLVLKDYLGDIRWEFSLPGEDRWTLLTADLSDSIQVFPGGSAEYRAFVTSGHCAPDSSNVIRIDVLNSGTPFADAGEDTTICPGDSIRLQASGGDAYKWDPQESLDIADIPDPWAKPLATTDYVVFVTSQDGITDSDTVTVTVLPRPRVYAGEDRQVCSGDRVLLTAEGEGRVIWQPMALFGEPVLREQFVSVDTTTTFRAVIIDSLGCRGADRVTIFATPRPVPDAGPDQRLSATYETWMDATIEPGESGTWEVVPGMGNGVFENIHQPRSRVSELEPGVNLFLWVVSNEFCPGVADEVEIFVDDHVIPTVITPNGDGKNDYFLVRGIDSSRESELTVLNRWGEVLFNASPYLNNWNGIDQNGNELPEGTYYIILKFTKDDIRKSFVVIIR